MRLLVEVADTGDDVSSLVEALKDEVLPLVLSKYKFTKGEFTSEQGVNIKFGVTDEAPTTPTTPTTPLPVPTPEPVPTVPSVPTSSPLPLPTPSDGTPNPIL